MISTSGVGRLHHVGDRGSASFRRRDRIRHVHGVIELRGEVDATVRVVREVLDRAVHDLRVADHRVHVVGRVDRRGEQADRAHGALDLAGEHVVADLERPQHEDEGARREVGEQAAPRGADGDAERGDQRGERRRLDAEVAEDADHQQHVQCDADDVADVADDRRLDLLALERLVDQRSDEADQPAADDVEDDRADDLQRERDDRRGFAVS